MKIFRKLVYVFAFTSLLGSSISQAADLKEGFMGVQWGTNIADLPDFEKVAEKHDVTYYGDPTKSYTLFDVNVPYVTYAFYSEKLFAAYVEVESIVIFGKLKDHLTRKYGLPKTTLKFNEGQTIHIWKYQDTKIKLKLYEKVGKMKLGFYYEPLTARVNRELREAYPPPRKPLFPLDKTRLREAMEVYGF